MPISALRRLMDKIGGAGYEIIGEALMDKFGIPRPTTASQTGPVSLPPRMYEALRSRMRGVITSRVDTAAIIGEV